MTPLSPTEIEAILMSTLNIPLFYIAEIHEKFVVVPADIASNNIAFICKTTI